MQTGSRLTNWQDDRGTLTTEPLGPTQSAAEVALFGSAATFAVSGPGITRTIARCACPAAGRGPVGPCRGRTPLLDLLTEDEERTRHNVFEIMLLARGRHRRGRRPGGRRHIGPGIARPNRP